MVNTQLVHFIHFIERIHANRIIWASFFLSRVVSQFYTHRTLPPPLLGLSQYHVSIKYTYDEASRIFPLIPSYDC
jgi:hypothetical protein